MAMRSGRTNDYHELRDRIKQQHLLDRQGGYYWVLIALTVALFAATLLLLLLVHDSWLIFPDAALLAFASGQLAFIGHDAAHRQIFESPGRNDLLGLAVFNVLLGLSNWSWRDKHNEHHSNPNQLDHDPDIEFPVVAFSEEQVAAKRGIARFMVSYQAFFIVPLLAFELINLRGAMLKRLVLNRPRVLVLESALMGMHFVFYFGLLFSVLGIARGLLFAAVHQGLLGIYAGAVFAPNHKGMPVLESGSKLDFLRRQILTARNLKANPVTDVFTGSLSCQIEHHLFPTMPRRNLRKAEKVTKAFCAERSIPYYETGLLRSYLEIFQHLHRVSAPLRTGRG